MQNIWKWFEKVKITYFIQGALIGSIIFLALYGIKVLDVTNVEWLKSSGDLTQHFFGWEFYRRSDWSFPIGLIKGLTYPYHGSISYMDSIPIFAIIFKIFRGFLPDNFQYFGIWGLTCFILQGGIFSIILAKYEKKHYMVALYSFVIFTVPMLYIRMFGHSALGGQWIILFALYMWFCLEEASIIKRIAVWSIILSLAVAIHPYFCPIVGIILAGDVLRDFIKKRNIKEELLMLTIPVITAAIVFFIIGGFYGKGSSGGLLGYYSMNINSIINSNGISRFLKTLPHYYDGQAEGINYFGLGVVVLILIYLFNQVIGLLKKKPVDKVNTIIGGIIILVSLILAMSPTITLNDKMLLDYTNIVPDVIISIWSIFRSTGRLFWGAYYLIMVSLIVYFVNKGSKYKIILVLCVFLQIVDVKDFVISWCYGKFGNSEYVSQMDSKIFEQGTGLADYIEHIQIIPADTKNWDILAEYALNNDLTLSDVYLPRGSLKAIEKYAQDQFNDILNGSADNKTLFVFNNKTMFAQAATSEHTDKLTFAQVDELWIAFSSEFDYSEYENEMIIYKKDINVERIKLSDYFERLNDYVDNKNYLVLISTYDDTTTKINQEIIDAANKIGLQFKIGDVIGSSYVGALKLNDKLPIYEQTSIEEVFVDLTDINNDIKSNIVLRSSNMSGAVADILINDIQYSWNSRGINMVIYDIESGEVVESANFDTFKNDFGYVIK